MVVMEYTEMKPQINADERGFITTLFEIILLYSFHLIYFKRKIFRLINCS